MNNIYDKRLELRAVKTALSGGNAASHMLALLREDHVIYRPAQKALARAFRLLKTRGMVPSWDEVLHDLTIDEGARNILKGYKGKPFQTKNGIKGAVDTLENYRRSRVIVKAAKYVVEQTNEDSFDVDAIEEFMHKELTKARKGSDEHETMIHVGKGNNSNQMVKKILRGEGVTMIPTGFEAWDNINGGLPLGGVMLLSAPTGRGKTAFALQMHKNFADHGIDSAFVEMEMSHEALYTRRLSNIAQVEMSKLMDAKKRLKQEDIEKSVRAHLKRVARLQKSGTRETFFVPSNEITMGEVLRTLKPYGHHVIIVDYVGLLAGMGGDRQWQLLGESIREATVFARDRCLVIVCAQLNDEGKIKYSKTMTEHVQNWWSFQRTKEELEAGYLKVTENKGRNQNAIDFYVKMDLSHMTYDSLTEEEVNKIKTTAKNKKKGKGIDSEVDDDYFEDIDEGGGKKKTKVRRGIGSYPEDDDEKPKGKQHRGEYGGTRKEISSI